MPEERQPGRYLVAVKHELDRSNGCWTWHCRVEEVDEKGNLMQGPIMLYGGDTTFLNTTHEGSHEHYLLNHVKPQMMKHYDDWVHDHSDAIALIGKSL